MHTEQLNKQMGTTVLTGSNG